MPNLLSCSYRPSECQNTVAAHVFPAVTSFKASASSPELSHLYYARAAVNGRHICESQFNSTCDVQGKYTMLPREIKPNIYFSTNPLFYLTFHPWFSSARHVTGVAWVVFHGFCFCLRLLHVHSVCIVYIYIYSKGSSACMALQLCLLHVLFIDRAARDPTQASDISVRCTRQFKGSDQEIDCGSEGGMREKHELGRNILEDLKVLNKLVSSPCFPPPLHWDSDWSPWVFWFVFDWTLWFRCFRHEPAYVMEHSMNHII